MAAVPGPPGLSTSGKVGVVLPLDVRNRKALRPAEGEEGPGIDLTGTVDVGEATKAPKVRHAATLEKELATTLLDDALLDLLLIGARERRNTGSGVEVVDDIDCYLSPFDLRDDELSLHVAREPYRRALRCVFRLIPERCARIARQSSGVDHLHPRIRDVHPPNIPVVRIHGRRGSAPLCDGFVEIVPATIRGIGACDILPEARGNHRCIARRSGRLTERQPYPSPSHVGCADGFGVARLTTEVDRGREALFGDAEDLLRTPCRPEVERGLTEAFGENSVG